MEDRYLFKAKRVDNGEWVYGVPFEIEGKTVILISDNLERQERQADLGE